MGLFDWLKTRCVVCKKKISKISSHSENEGYYCSDCWEKRMQLQKEEEERIEELKTERLKTLKSRFIYQGELCFGGNILDQYYDTWAQQPVFFPSGTKIVDEATGEVIAKKRGVLDWVGDSLFGKVLDNSPTKKPRSNKKRNPKKTPKRK